MNYKSFLPFNLIIAFLLFSFTLKSQNVGQGIFQKHCAVCHSIGDEKILGPGLKGVTERLEQDWLISFIKNSTKVIKSGDEYAVKLYKDYNNVQMPAMENLSDEEIIEILKYIESGGIVEEVETKLTIITNDDIEKFLEHDDIKRGERLFLGLIPLGDDAKGCTECHYVKYSTEFSWAPNAFELAKNYEEKTVSDLQFALFQPQWQKLREVHRNYEMTGKELASIKGYLNELAHEGSPQQKPIINTILIFLFLLFVNLVFIIDLIFFKKIKYKAIHVVFILGTGLFLLKIISHEAIELGRQQNYAPDQPIKFSHQIHAGQNQTDCMYCHSSAENSKSAGIPSQTVCLNCHSVVREGTNSGKFEINKIYAAIEEKRSIEWIRVHNLPDHAFFSHAQHVSVGKLECQQCHGPVETMDVLSQYTDLSMGWCINCHRETKVEFAENEFYKEYLKLQEQFQKGEIDSVTVSMVGGTDCSKCHY
jgi:cytochrome c551/c552